jgi:hypothetical protein
MYRTITVLTAAGAAGAFLYGGTAWLAGVLLGAGFSILNFWLIHRLVLQLGGTGQEQRGGGAPAVLLGGRYLLFGAAGYAILKFFDASITAALFGCFVAVAAVILEIFFELIYGT